MKIHSSCNSLESLWLRAVSQTALQGVPSYFHISGCSAGGLGVSALLTLLHCLSLLEAREAESYRLKEARTPCEYTCYKGYFQAAHRTRLPTGCVLLPLDGCFETFPGLSEQEAKWRELQTLGLDLLQNSTTTTKTQISESRDPCTLAFLSEPLWKGIPQGNRGAERCVLVSCAQINKPHPRLKVPGLFLAPLAP